MFDQAHAPSSKQPGYESSGKTDLDLEIERYQREIEEKQRRSRSGQETQSTYPSSPPSQQQPAQSRGMAGQGNAQQDYEVYNINNPSFGAQQQQPVQPMIGSNEDEEMFFTSVDTDRQKKPGKRPINPRTQQQKGFLSKFFNKDMT